jgi:integrase/recombinase XerD
VKPENFAELYLTHLQSLNRAPATVDWYRKLLQRFEAFAEGRSVGQWCDVTTGLLLDYQKHVHGLLNTHGRPYAVAAQNLHLIVLDNLFRYLKRAGQLAHNPAAELERAREPQRLPRAVPTAKEIKRLLSMPDPSTVLGYRDRTIMEVFYSTGLRLRELIKLKVTDLDLDHGSLIVREGKGRKDRVVPLGRVAVKYLETYLQGIRPELLPGVRASARQNPPAKSDTGHVFLTVNGGPFSGRAVALRLDKYVRRVKLSARVTPHVFRHACATHMIRNCANIRHVQEMLGHSKLDTTERYLHLTIADLKEAHARFHPREKDA